jgi:TM2 domain-containing membrane protein YozV
MSQSRCPNCGSEMSPAAKFCAYCGYQREESQAPPQQTATYGQPQYQQFTAPPLQPQYGTAPAPQAYATTPTPTKDRTIAALLAIFLGTFGIHKFYLGDIGLGIVYVIFSWTGIPALIGFIEGIIYFTKTDAEFQRDIVDPIMRKR